MIPATELKQVRLFIDGEWTTGSDQRVIENRNPATGELLGHVAVASRSDLQQAAEAVGRGFESWRRLSALERSVVLRRAASLLLERLQDIATAMTVEQGKTLEESTLEATLAAEIIEWFAEEGRRAYGRTVPSRSAGVQQTVIQVPVGPVAAFAPWNFPLTQVARKVSAALAAGCSIVIKPPEEAPISTSALFQCFVDAGVPRGTINLLYGIPAEISEYLIPHPVIKKISFTGSTAVGKRLASLAGAHMKRITMELGGHAPAIVTASADVALAAQRLSAAKWFNSGQVCIAPTRFLVHTSVFDEFVSEFLSRTSQIVVGDGLAESTTMGPLNNERRLLAMESIVSDARAKGATVLTGGERIGERGLYFAPTVITDVSDEMDLMREEPFGPIAILIRYAELSDAIAEANRLPYGLAAYAFSDSAAEIAHITEGVETGMLGVNHTAIAYAETPFGGVQDSGYGSDGGREALHGYLQPELVTIASF
jgi:succinate-semialdehyde dehydrogenase/glutarate-semialdehyde dehydrogenase